MGLLSFENLIVGGFFIGCSVFFYFIMDFFNEDEKESSRQLDRLKSYVEQSMVEHDAQKEAQEASWADRASAETDVHMDPLLMEERRGNNQLLQNIGVIVGKFTPKKRLEERQKLLVQADLPLRANEFVALQLGLAAVAGVICRLIFKNIGAMAGGMVVGWIFPSIWLTIMISRRKSAFQDQILDTLLMTASGLKAGYSFLQSMELVCKEGAPPMQRELSKVIRENGLGLPLEDTMGAMNERTSSDDWDLVTTVILIQRQIGGNLAEILEKIAATIRTRIQIKGDIAAKTAQGRASGMIVGALPFGIGIMIYQSNPGYISKLWTFEFGRFKGIYVTIAALIWEFIGIWIILKIVDIDV